MKASLVHMKRIPLLLLALVALAAAGCGSSNKSSSSSSSASTPDSTPATTPATTSTPSGGSAKPVKLVMKNIAFSPATVTVKVGQKVTWTNLDDAPHNVTGGPLHSPTFSKGGSFSYTPTKAGTIKYVCTIHPGMNGTLTVTS